MVYKQIPNLSRYEVSDTGIIRTNLGRELSPYNNSGYLAIQLINPDGIRKSYLMHRLVYITHRGPIVKPLQVNHKNGIKTDNRLENLELMTPSENLYHAYRELKCNRARGERVHTYKLTVLQLQALNDLLKLGYSQRKIGDIFNISQSAVSQIIAKNL